MDAKTLWHFTPDPRCDNCEGTGIFGTDEDGQPDEPCIFCLEDSILRGEIDGTIGDTTYENGVAMPIPPSDQESFP